MTERQTSQGKAEPWWLLLLLLWGDGYLGAPISENDTMTRAGDGSPAVTGVVPVIPHMFTDMIEQLQQGYVRATVAATAGCSVEFAGSRPLRL